MMIFKEQLRTYDEQCEAMTAGKSTRDDDLEPLRRNLQDLPSEILEQIYLDLDLHHRLVLHRCCSSFKSLYDSSATLQYLATLQTSAYLDVPGGSVSVSVSGSSHAATATGGSSERQKEPDRRRRRQGSESDIPGVIYTGSQGDEGDNDPNPRVEGGEQMVPLSTSEKNELLKAREGRWSRLHPASEQMIRIRGPAGVYELQEGIFLMCHDYSHLDQGRPTSIRLIPLPSADDPTGSKIHLPMKAHKLPFSIADLTMDPTQDLIVVSEHRAATNDPTQHSPTHRYHLLTLSSFKPHPEATLSILDFPPFSAPDTQTRQLLQIMDDVLVILVSRYVTVPWFLAGMGAAGIGGLGGGNEEEIVCWNWKTGRVLARLDLDARGWFSSFALLTPTSFMVTSIARVSDVFSADEPRNVGSAFPPVIQIYSFAPDPDRSIIPVQPLDFHYMDDTTPHPVLLAQLSLPDFVDGVMIGAFDVRPDPAFNPRRSDRKAFTQDPEKGVLVFELQTAVAVDGDHDHEIGTNTYDLFVLRETMVNMAKAGEERLREMRKSNECEPWRVPEVMSWSRWGEKNARIMNRVMRNRNWVCSCSGYRFISLLTPGERDDGGEPQMDEEAAFFSRIPPRPHDLFLLDFSPYSVRRELQARRERLNNNNATSDSDSVSEQLDIDGRSEDDSESMRGTEAEPGLVVRVVDQPSVLNKGLVWKDDITSGLPYVEITREMGVRANGVMMDDQRIIAVSTLDREGGDLANIRQEMTVFCM